MTEHPYTKTKSGRFMKGCLIILVIIGLLFIGLSIYRAVRPPRENYGEIDFDNDKWIQRFVSEYEEAKVNGDEWINNPEEVALRVAGYPNPDNISPQEVEIDEISNDQIVITVLSKKLWDDSISRQEYRVELRMVNGNWLIEWAGLRQMCSRGSLGGWTKSPCQ